jgi:hypothetical protein
MDRGEVEISDPVAKDKDEEEKERRGGERIGKRNGPFSRFASSSWNSPPISAKLCREKSRAQVQSEVSFERRERRGGRERERERNVLDGHLHRRLLDEKIVVLERVRGRDPSSGVVHQQLLDEVEPGWGQESTDKRQGMISFDAPFRSRPPTIKKIRYEFGFWGSVGLTSRTSP